MEIRTIGIDLGKTVFPVRRSLSPFQSFSERLRKADCKIEPHGNPE